MNYYIFMQASKESGFIESDFPLTREGETTKYFAIVSAFPWSCLKYIQTDRQTFITLPEKGFSAAMLKKNYNLNMSKQKLITKWEFGE